MTGTFSFYERGVFFFCEIKVTHCKSLICSKQGKEVKPKKDIAIWRRTSMKHAATLQPQITHLFHLKPFLKYTHAHLFARTQHDPQALMQVVRGVSRLGSPAAAGLAPGAARSWVASHLRAAASLISGASLQAGHTMPRDGAGAVRESLNYLSEREDFSGSVHGGLDRSIRGTRGFDEEGPDLGAEEGVEVGAAGLCKDDVEGSIGSSSRRSSGSGVQGRSDSWAGSSDNGSAEGGGGEEEEKGGTRSGAADNVPASCSFLAEELAQLLYALVRMRVRPPQKWLKQVLWAFEHSPGMMDSLAR